MPKKCPPGVICIENVTLFILAILFSIIAYFVYLYFQDKNQQTSSDVSYTHLTLPTNREV